VIDEALRRQNLSCPDLIGHPSSSQGFNEVMDCRVKPGNDGWKDQTNIVRMG
jgi:hypothetical protein